MMMRHGVMIMTTDRVYMGTRQAVSLHRRNVAEGETGMTEICMMSSVVEMHVAESKTDVRAVSVLNRSGTKKGIMTTMVPITTNLTDNVLPKGGHNAGGVKAFSQDLKRARWPLNFKPSGIEKSDWSTNPAK
jgi:hypothetical protein